MVDAAVGSKSVLGRALESAPGLPEFVPDDFKFMNFESADLARASKENKSNAITGFGGEDRGTPGEVSFEKKIKYDMTVDRVLLDLLSEFGAPASDEVLDLGNGALSGEYTITVPGTGYTVGDDVTFVGTTGAGAAAKVSAIDGSGGVTALTFSAYGSSYTGTVDADFSAGTGTLAAATAVIRLGPWLVPIRPGAAAPVPRAISMYFYEGGAYTAGFQFGRRCGGLSLADAANKRVQVDPDYTEPTGETVSGFPIAKSTNTSTNPIAKMATRGRRPYDANYDAGKSIYLKVIAASAGEASMKAAFDTASGATDGTGFPATVFGAATFTVRKGDWATMVDSNDIYASPIGLFGENNEPYELTFGDEDLDALVVGDLFEIPYILSPVEKQVIAENRLSTFHLTNVINGASVLIDAGTTKWMRPFKEYYSNSRRFPSQVDPTGDIMGSMQFKKRLFDVAFRKVQEASARVSAVQTYKFGDPIITDVYEGIEVFYPQLRVDTMKSGDVPNKNTLEETITLMAEQPDAEPSQPTSVLTPGGNHFDTSAQFPFQINVVTLRDPSTLTTFPTP